jgi:hypothetical protein
VASAVIDPSATAASIFAVASGLRGALKPELSAAVVMPSFAATVFVSLSE